MGIKEKIKFYIFRKDIRITLAIIVLFIFASYYIYKYISVKNYELQEYIIPDILENLYYAAGIILVLGLGLAIDSYVDDHEYRRRRCAIDLIMDWNNSNKDGIFFLARKIIKDTSKAQREAIKEFREFKINSDLYRYIKVYFIYWNYQYLKDNPPHSCECGGMVAIDENQVIVIRQIIITYLNRLECLLSAAINKVADFDIIAEQFFYIVKPEENFLGVINDFGWEKHYPCILQFIKTFDKKYKEKPLTGN